MEGYSPCIVFTFAPTNSSRRAMPDFRSPIEVGDKFWIADCGFPIEVEDKDMEDGLSLSACTAQAGEANPSKFPSPTPASGEQSLPVCPVVTGSTGKQGLSMPPIMPIAGSNLQFEPHVSPI